MRKKFLNCCKGIMMLAAMSASCLSVNADNPPLMGWSSWNTYGFQINDSVIQSQVDAMVNLGFYAKGYNHINIDDGFFGGRDANGKLLIHPTRFPNGLRPLVDYIHSKGLKAGIYSDAGANTCASYWGNPKDTIGIGVGLYGHDAQDFDLYFNELNFDFIKIDYCGADGNNNADGLNLDVKQRYEEIAAALQAVGRDDITWNICRWAFPGTWACSIADSWRTTEDIYLGWESVKSIINQSLYLSAYTSYGHYNDMDMLEVGRGLTDEEDKTHFGMWCIMSSPLLIGCDMNDIKGNALALMQNEELIALNQNTLGLQAYVVKRTNGAYVLVKDVETLNGNKRAVAIYNPTNAAVNVNVEFSLLDLAGNVKVRDLFERKDVGTKSGSMSVSVPAHGTRIYTLEAEQRLERTLYEAETAWLTSYQEIKNNETEGTAIYSENSSCSGGVNVGWLGNGESNDIQWRNVFSNEGGEYTLSIAYISGDSRSMNISINGETPIETTVNSGSWSTVAVKEFTVQLQKGNNTVRIYNKNGWMPNIDYIRVKSTAVPEVVEDYPIVFDKDQDYTHASRRLNSVSLGGQTISLPTPLKVYSCVDTPVFSARAGETVSPKFGFSGNWMHGFVYIDCGQDGAFEAKLNADGSIPQGSDIMAFSYAEPNLGSGTGYNSKGERVTNSNVLNPPAFTVPANLANGFYRMRYKVDWASIDPAGRAEDGNGIIKNGGAVCDVRLNVHDGYCNVTCVADNGEVKILSNAVNGRYTFGEPLKIKVQPKSGYAVDAIKICHGHNLDGAEYIHGVKQYDSEVVPGFLLSGDEYEISAGLMDGDVKVEVLFARDNGAGGDGYALSFDKNQNTENVDYTIKVNGNALSKVAGTADYYDFTSDVPVLLNATRSISVSVDDALANAVDKYLFIDLNNDGRFTTVFNTVDGVEQPSVSSELVAYTYYNGMNSIGEQAQSCPEGGASLPAYSLPQQLPDGIYRARLKMDTDNISPDGSPEFGKGGCVIVDFLLNVIDGNVTIEQYTVNGSIDGANSTALPLNVKPSQQIIGVLRGAPGHSANKVVVRHGHNLSGEQYVNGNCQWKEETVEAMSDGKFVVPASAVDGDVEIYAVFEKAAGSDWHLVFSDEFNADDYTQPIDSKWMRCQRQGATWNRWLSDSEEVVYLQGGDLVARAIPNPDKENDPVDMITGGIKSNKRFGFTYGYVEARIFNNLWIGNFPAFWMMPENQAGGWPDCGEIDIWETIDNENRSYHTVHSNWTYDLGQTNNPRSSHNTAVTYDRYHTFGLMWNETSLVWYVDGKEVGRYTKSSNQSALEQGQWPFDKHFHLILNQSVGNGAWAANADVSHTYETRFDWVRVYQRAGMENTDGTVGIPVVEQESGVEVYPISGGIVVMASVPTRVEVADVAGRNVYAQTVENVTNIQLPCGFYIVNGVKVMVR